MKTYILVLGIIGCCAANAIPKPKSLTVNCESLGNSEEFQNRLMIRENAEDKTTIWLMKGEQLTINFDLPQPATVEVLDLRYSNDGDYDEVSVHMDDVYLGGFKTSERFAWGQLWNKFTSSGPLGEPQKLATGRHSVTMKVLDADVYGLEIDYIRINVHGAVMQNLDQQHFICVHKPGKADNAGAQTPDQAANTQGNTWTQTQETMVPDAVMQPDTVAVETVPVESVPIEKVLKDVVAADEMPPNRVQKPI